MLLLDDGVPEISEEETSQQCTGEADSAYMKTKYCSRMLDPKIFSFSHHESIGLEMFAMKNLGIDR